MDTLKPIIFLFPIIALILVSLLFAFSLKKVADKKAFNRYILMVTGLAFVFNQPKCRFMITLLFS
jgi:predicted ATPase